ncbi:complement C1s-1 subcomponent-like [Heptranchias perlo]|uniref:complement C1s-1 subcomponent-like n=1 Tax=Heptranchias perlo TaxID=212740 RepID=UPI00355969EA
MSLISHRPPVFMLLMIPASGTIHLNQPFGELSSPNHPLRYPANSNEAWDISAPQGYIIKIYVPYVDIERSEGCQTNHIKILSEEKELARLCGKREDDGSDPGLHEYYSTSNSLRVLFTSTDSETKPFTGFLALYSRVDVNECELEAHGCSHYCGNTIGGYYCYCPLGFVIQSDKQNCKKVQTICPNRVLANTILQPPWLKFNFQDTVKVTCVRGYEIVEGLKTIPYFFAECQQDGSWKSPGYSCQLVDCSAPSSIENGRFAFITETDVTTYRSSIRYQCNEPYYQLESESSRDFFCKADGTWENNRTGQVLPKCAPECGKPSNPVIFHERVLKGSVAKWGSFPWQVYFQQPRGAGALISDRWVLTAAHVVHMVSSFSMIAGIINLKNMNRGTRLFYDQVFIHPRYKHPKDGEGGYNYDNDIALVRLRSKVQMGPNLSPVCLPRRDPQHQIPANKLGLVSGWGVTENDTLPTDLMFVRLAVTDMEECRNQTAGHRVTVTENMICAGGEGGSDACQGDSGGAFVFTRPKPRNNEFFVGGIVSWGIKCGTFGFYTKVVNYLDWMEHIMRAASPPLKIEFKAHYCSNGMGMRLLPVWALLLLWDVAGGVASSNLSGMLGEIHSPNYHPRKFSTWAITIPRGFALKLRLRHFDYLASSSCKHNYVEVFADRERLGKFCGNVTSVHVHRPSSKATASDSHSVKLRARYNSLGQESRRGFSIFYEAVDIDECGFRWEGKTPCHHFCHNYIGGYQCYCRQGYGLHSDRKTCEVVKCSIPDDLENGSYEHMNDHDVTLLTSVISYKCNRHYYGMAGGGNGLYTCEANGKWMNSNVGEVLPTCEPVCGRPREPPSFTQRIFGGALAQEGNFPWQVYFETTVCGGALVSDRWVLTSASCVEHEETLRMLAGGTDRNALAQWSPLESEEILTHPRFARLPADQRRSDFDNDIALIKLKKRIKMGPTISPICLPANDPKYKVGVGKVGYVSGFGKTELFAETDVLMFALIPVVEMERCRNTSLFSRTASLTENMLCAGSEGVDACTGDGGGAFVVADPRDSDAYYAAGVVSWGIKCGTYGIYTNVMNYLDWIESTMAGIRSSR